jgi:hypothetical protein
VPDRVEVGVGVEEYEVDGCATSENASTSAIAEGSS